MPDQNVSQMKSEDFPEHSSYVKAAALPHLLQQRFLRAASVLTTAYLCAMFLGHPLIFSSFYFNITETKQVYFLIASGIYLLLLLFARIALPPDCGVTRIHAFPHPTALLLYAFFVVSLVGSLISRYPGEAFFGENNRYQGLLTLFCYACLVFALSRREADLRWPERAFIVGACAVSLLGVLNHFALDPFGFYENLRTADRGRFLSTIGNADFYASYIVMAFAVSYGFFLRAKEKLPRVLSGLALALVSFGTFVSGSDSTALGLIAVAVIAPLLLFSDAGAMRRMPLGWGVFFLCAFLFGLLSPALTSATYLSSFVTLLRRFSVSLPLAVIALAIWFSLCRVKQERISRAKKTYAILLICVLLLGLLALVLFNTLLKEIPLGNLEQYIRFRASWGTDRGKIWAFVLRVYAGLPTAQQFFGASSGALFHADTVKPLFSDASLDAAHNEYLQYLVTNGLLGLCCYLAAIILALRTGFRRSAGEPAYRGWTLAVVAYLAQAVVSIAQPMTTPIFFLLIGILITRRAAPVISDP